MNRRSLLLGASALGLAAFAGGSWFYRNQQRAAAEAAGAAALAAAPEALIRPYSPILGPVDAPVTVVEFFDPSCEACRAFHPVIEALLAEFPTELRIVLRYTPFHDGSDEAVRILETARMQGKFEHVLNALFERQPDWAVHGQPRMDVAWRAAGATGFSIAEGQAARLHPDITAVLNQDVADVRTMQISGTPTFFLQGRLLTNLSLEGFRDQVRAAVAAAG